MQINTGESHIARLCCQCVGVSLFTCLVACACLFATNFVNIELFSHALPPRLPQNNSEVLMLGTRTLCLIYFLLWYSFILDHLNHCAALLSPLCPMDREFKVSQVMEDYVLALLSSVEELPESTKTVISVLSVVSWSEIDLITLTDSQELPINLFLYLCLRRGLRGFTQTPLLAIKRFYIRTSFIKLYILSALPFDSGLLVSLLLRITDMSMQ